MFDSFLTKIFGSRNDRLIRQYRKRCAQINKLEPEIQALTDEQLRGKTAEFRERLDKGETLDALLPEAFAVVREASRRVLGMRHFDVQLIGGMVLNDGKIAEMRTGEGKTLTATLAVYLNALPAKGVHVVTVNDYLASRDAAWMGRLYNFLGMTVGTILSQQDTESKKAAYAADITYGTNNEFGFDYLRDNMEYEVANRRQRPLAYAIVDEVDSILIDEARTPLIISGAADDNTDLYKAVNEIPPLLTRQAEEKGEGDYWVDEKAHQVYLSEKGHEKVEKILTERGLIANGSSLYSPQNIILMHHLNASLRAHTLFFRDQQYVVQNGEVVIVDEFTGRLMPGRRWSEGLHQAIEAKEGVKIITGMRAQELIYRDGEVVGVNTFMLNEEARYAVAIDELIRDVSQDEVPYELAGQQFPIFYIAIGAAVIILIIIFVVIFATRRKSEVVAGSGPVPVPAPAPDPGVWQQTAPEPVPDYTAHQSSRYHLSGGIASPLAGKTYGISQETIIGRDGARCDIVFPVDTKGVSAKHCKVTPSAEGILLSDLGSTYGTFLANGTKVEPGQNRLLHPGDAFYLGGEDNRFEVR